MDEPVFTEPWHAQLFAVTVHLHDQGLFAWPDWTVCFGACLKKHGLQKDLDGGNDYFLAWLDALEQMLAKSKTANAPEIEALSSAWREAYLSTPHGHPVRLKTA